LRLHFISDSGEESEPVDVVPGEFLLDVLHGVIIAQYSIVSVGKVYLFLRKLRV
jgi:hypothetical protein